MSYKYFLFSVLFVYGGQVFDGTDLCLVGRLKIDKWCGEWKEYCVKKRIKKIANLEIASCK